MSVQDPEFENFKQAFHEERFDDALLRIQTLLIKHPKSFALHWHHARVLEKLGRFRQARIVLNKVLKFRSDFVPALILQVQLDFHDDSDADIEDDIFNDEPAQSEQARFNLIEQRLYKILSIDPNAIDALHMLSGLLRGHEDDIHLKKANQLLNRAISLAPERVDLLEDRANSFLASAINHKAVDDTADLVTTFSGTHFKRGDLENALADFRRCYELSHQHRYGLRVGSILHDLGRFDEALAVYDEVLAHVPEDDPYRPLIIERRARSENNGVGEREHMAQLLEAAVSNDGNDRSLDDNNVAQVILSAANAVRSGMPVSEALNERLSDDADDNMATSIAAQILNVANEPAPDLVEVDPKEFPAYQQKFIEKCKQDLNKLGLRHVGDAEARGMRLILGQRVLLSFFANESGETGISCFCMKPKKLSPIASLFLLLTGKWKTLVLMGKVNKMVECVSQFADGDHLTTQYLSVSPFEYGPPIYVEKVSPKLSAADLVTRHRERFSEYKQTRPGAKATRVFDLAGMEQRWVKSQAAKSAYRKQVGFITEPELRELLGSGYDRYAEKVRAKLAVLAAGM